MPGAEQNGVCLKILLATVLFDFYSVNISVSDNDIGHLTVENNFTAERYYLLTDGADNLGQPVRTYMGLCRPAYLLRSAMKSQFIDNNAAQRIFYTGCQLAVREGSGAALAELHIGFGIQTAAAPEAENILLPVLYM